MQKVFRPKVVSANDLFEGDVVYLAADGGWTRELGHAAVAETPEASSELLDRADQPGRVVGPYLIDVVRDPGGNLAPLHFREQFRVTGPSILVDQDIVPGPALAAAE